MLDVAASSESPGPAAFACAYLNGRSDRVPPLLLALNGLDDVSSLLAAAQGAFRRGNVDADPTVVFTPDGVVISKATRVSELRPNAMLILSCGEPFDPQSVPERARRMHATAQRELQKLGPLVRAEQGRFTSADDVGVKRPSSQQERRAPPWRFSPSGNWKREGLALRPHYRA